MTLLLKKICNFFYLFIGFGLLISISYANENKILTACAEPWPPFDYQENAQLKGSNIELNQHIFKKLNIPLKISIMPWQLCWQMVKSGKIDMAFMVSKKENRQSDVYYSEKPTDQLNYVWVIDQLHNPELSCTQSVCPINQDKKLKIGIINGNSYSDELSNCIKNNAQTITVKKYPTLSYAFRMLLSDQIQMIPSVDSIANYYIDRMKTNHLTVCQKTLFSKEYYSVFSKASKFSNQNYADITAVKKAYNQNI